MTKREQIIEKANKALSGAKLRTAAAQYGTGGVGGLGVVGVGVGIQKATKKNNQQGE
jgi:hypothetical protein